jgi:hypothetical protein
VYRKEGRNLNFGILLKNRKAGRSNKETRSTGEQEQRKCKKLVGRVKGGYRKRKGKKCKFWYYADEQESRKKQ